MNNEARRVRRSMCGLNPTATPNYCFQSGRRSGYAAGINKTIPVSMDVSKDIIRDIARQSGVRNYSSMTRQQMVDALLARNITEFRATDLGKY